MISTEGTHTEAIYFQEFRPTGADSFRLKVLCNPTQRSHPVEVVQRLIDYENHERPGTNTEYWAIINRSSWPLLDFQFAYELVSRRKGFHIAMSNPCFELWLWLHLNPNEPFSDHRDCKNKLERGWFQYSESRYLAGELIPHSAVACDRAAEITDPEDGLLDSQGTQVFRLVRRLSNNRRPNPQ